ncbi:hypothetical protein IGB42_01443 [Andreprevotia sp. IGB-42]|nr:hypothetical protein IGB42_01443 [Andreprevotia sp. IGB-42]
MWIMRVEYMLHRSKYPDCQVLPACWHGANKKPS